MTRLLLSGCALSLLLEALAFYLLTSRPFAAAVLSAVGGGIALAISIAAVLEPRAQRAEIVDRRVIR